MTSCGGYFRRAIQLSDAFVLSHIGSVENPLMDEQSRRLAEDMLRIICEGCPYLHTEFTAEAQNHLVTPATDPFPVEYDMAAGQFRGVLLGFKLTPYYEHDYSKLSFGLATILSADISGMYGTNVPSLVFTPLDGHSTVSLIHPEQLN
jgi:hypothetical protein